MRISDWSSDVCSSDLPPSTEATTTSEAPNEATTTTEATTTSAPSTTTTVPSTTTTTSRDSEELTPSGPATPGTIGEEPSTSIDGTRVVKAGESFWSIAEDVVKASSGGDATIQEVTSYWADLIEANRADLPDPGNPDLIYVGPTLQLPSP